MINQAPMNTARLQARQDDDPVGKLVGNIGNAVLGAVASKVLEPALDAAGEAIDQVGEAIGPAVSD